MIRVNKYVKVYEKTLAVDGLSFDVGPGTILGMVGPNGSGKTTTMRAIAGIIKPTSGQITVAGHDIVTQPREAKQLVAFIPDDPKLFATLTVWEHLRFVAAAYQISDFESAADDLLQQFELVEKRNALASELSRGMRQKVAICCAYLQEPQVIMFDEPHTGLDPLAIRRMKSTIQDRARAGAAIIISSHLLGLIEDLCTDLLILSKGKRLFCGAMSELAKEHPELEAGTSLEEIFFKTTGRDSLESETTDAPQTAIAEPIEADPIVDSDSPSKEQ